MHPLRIQNSEIGYPGRMAEMNRNVGRRSTVPRDLPDWLISHGRHWITTDVIAATLAIPVEQVPPIVARLRRAGRMFSPTRGGYVPIPAEYRSWRAVPASHFIDSMMRYLGHEYYVGFLSAAEVHGAAHQRPQVFQVITDARLNDRTFDRVTIEFTTSAKTARRPTTVANTPTGTMKVAVPEITVLDLVASPAHGGGLSNIATVLGGLLGDGLLSVPRLAQLATDYPAAVAQRTGWLLERVASEVGVEVDLAPLDAIARARLKPTPLAAAGTRTGPFNERWNIVVNTDVEPDL
jgi:predicted transcriptional regulator of viral defense system